jgi:hypothetical protein
MVSPKQKRILHLLARPAPPPVKGPRGHIPQRHHLYRGRDTQFFVTSSAEEVYEPLTPRDVKELRASGLIEPSWPGTESQNDSFVITDRGRAEVEGSGRR